VIVQCRFASARSAGVGPAAAGVGPAAAQTEDDDDDDDFELFGSDEDQTDEAAEKLKQERLAAYEAKKATSE